MSSITQDHVREIVREENKYIEKTMTRLAESVEKMVEAVNKLAIQSHVTEEKFTRVHERIDNIKDLANAANKGVMSITTEILPDIEANVAINSFSMNKMWKIALAITLPLLGGAWVMVERFNNVQAGQTKILMDAIKELVKVAAG